MTTIYTNLHENPDYYSDTLKLIEKSFGYSSRNSYAIDFYPLMRKENHHNCFLLIEENKVVAHIAALTRTISHNDQCFNFTMYGGIAVSETERGKGYFKKLFQLVLNKFQDSTFHLLWSEKIDMYEKYLFFPCSSQYTYSQDLSDDFSYEKVDFSSLKDDELNQLAKIYNDAIELRINRTLDDWRILQHISSTDLYLKRIDNKIENYFFINKGEDLEQIIHEVGDFSDLENIRKYGIVWSPYYDEELLESLFATNLRIGNPIKFSQFVECLTDKKITIKNIGDSIIDFLFEGKAFSLGAQDFITGILGPSRFEELDDCPEFYISGLDSI